MKILLHIFVVIFLFSSKVHCLSDNQLINNIKANFHENYKKTDSLVDILITKISDNDDLQLLGEARLLKGSVLTRLNKYKQANKYLLLALKIFDQLQNDSLIIKTKLALGFNHHHILSHQYSIRINKEALRLAKSLSDSTLLFHCYYSLGRAYGWSQGMADEAQPDTIHLAIHNFNKAKNYITNWGDSLKFIPLLRGYGDAYLKLGIYEKSKYYFDLIYNLSQKDNKIGFFISAVNLGEIYTRKGKFQQAKYYLDIAERSAEELQDLFKMEWAYLNLYMYYKAISNRKKAILYKLKSLEMTVKRIKADQQAEISRLSLAYESEQKDQKLQYQNQILSLQSKNLQDQKWQIIVISLGLLTSLIFSLFYYRLFRKNKKISEKNIILLREQSHRVKNNLQVISALLSLQANRLEESEAKAAIEDSHHRLQVMSMIHQRLYDDNLLEINVKDLVLEISQAIIRSFWSEDKKLQIEYDLVDICLPIEKAVSLGLIVNELMTNSLKHAFASHQQPKINIRLRNTNRHRLQFYYSDNGPGFNPDKQEGKQSFGLLLIQLQSRQLFGKYGWQNDDGAVFNLQFKY